ncbi:MULTISPECIES: hypothetical protein [unclassified Bacillus (in: firmicutes)]|uniref:hypothetical protein n=1 Tax=unclassified Bacillus (in: firmicutes) TaxID=185979 RepID=UPI00178C5B9F|nr:MULTISPECIES: hypothetical protein [unclassified Bacillus (in: firmicutes)]
MSYYDNEVRKELEVEKVYTGRELAIFMDNARDNIMVLCDQNRSFDMNSEDKYKIFNRLDTYSHTHYDYSHQVNRKVVYIVKRVY